VQPLGNYDNRCRACHAGGPDAKAKLCKVGKAGCAGCHMPKIEIREAHNKFTDHWIRIVRAGEAAPN
jgi:formate-dependent nitrite reductase cytochrome c552 subunit